MMSISTSGSLIPFPPTLRAIFITHDPGSIDMQARPQHYSFQHDIEHKTGGAELKGFTNITMTMTARQYQELMKSPHVLFVDVIPAVAVEKARQTFGRALQGKPVITQYAPTYWYHEEAIDP
jgi:hypothetical protein